MAKRRHQAAELSLKPIIGAKNSRLRVEKLISSLEADIALRDILVSVIAEDTTLLEAINERAKENLAPDKPPVARGRRVEQEENIEGQWLRLEHVPCGSSRCKKDPDEHGPYWYSYKFLGGSWRAVYHGRQRPELRQEICQEKAQTLLNRLESSDSLDDKALIELGKIVVDLSTVKGPEAKALRMRAAALISQEEKRRDAQLKKTHRRLLEKVLSGKKLNKKERDSFDKVCQLLLSEH